MYKVASDKRQRRLHQGNVADWVNGAEKLPPEEQLRLLKDGLKVLEDRIAKAMPWEKRALGREKQRMQHEIIAFRTAHNLLRPRHNNDHLHHLFVDIAKEMLPNVQFEMIWNATLREYSNMSHNRLTATQRFKLRGESAHLKD